MWLLSHEGIYSVKASANQTEVLRVNCMSTRSLIVGHWVINWISNRVVTCVNWTVHELRYVSELVSAKGVRIRLCHYCEGIVGKLKSDWIVFIEVVYLVLQNCLLHSDVIRVDTRIFYF